MPTIFKIEDDKLQEEIIKVMKTIFDPEIPVDIYELGLIYEVVSDKENNVNIMMTLTSPMCPVAETLPPEVEQKIGHIEDVKSSKIELVWDPPWEQSMMSESAKLELDMF
ncbi:MAG: DUF59 domain-containing protein [Bacteroidia bacterium]|nr:DUF59 domain-containing protein [Bacteroidia bacterium]